MIAGCGSQLRVAGFGKPFALDFTAIMKIGEARGVDRALLAELLPEVQPAVLAPHHDADAGGGGD